MTYGFGCWRSGYTTLIPWHWAWTMRPDPFDYLRTTSSGAGQRIDENGEVIPAVYWECLMVSAPPSEITSVGEAGRCQGSETGL